MKYSFHKLIKRRAREIAKAQDIPLSQVLEQLALEYGFAHNYEMAQVAKRNPSDPRLISGAFGTADLQMALDEVDLTNHLQDIADEALSGNVAETNAYNFLVEDLEVTGATYDPSTGTLELDIAFQYSGDPDPDQVYHGHIFYVTDAKIRFCWRNNAWELTYMDNFDILNLETDMERDYEQQRMQGLI